MRQSQALAWMPLYRGSITKSKHLVEGVDITAATGGALRGTPQAAIEEILATRTAKLREASQLAFAFAQRHSIEPLLQAARRLLPSKSSGNPHDIKFPVAISEDLHLVSPRWRPHVAAAAVYSFWGADRADLPLIQQVRQAVRGV